MAALKAVSLCCSWCTQISASAIQPFCFSKNYSCVPEFSYQSVYCHLIRYLLDRIRTAKWFMNRGKRCRDVMLENEYTLCSWIHHVHICAASSKLQRPSSKGDLDSSVTGEVWRLCYTLWTCFWFHLYIVVRSTWVLLNLFLNITLSLHEPG
jgi:hypothetical protein